MSEWPLKTIGDFIADGQITLQTGPFGSQLHAYDYVPSGVPVIPTEGIKNRRIDHTVLPNISEDKAQELARHRLKSGDILFARRGVQATGHTAKIRNSEEGFICGTGAIRLRIMAKATDIFPAFLAELLALETSIEWFKFHAIGATMPNLNEGIIASFPLLVPTVPEQIAIAEILNALDDKIELNRRMNETLERQARALFRDWFVDFGPTRAKQSGAPSYLAPDLWNLFPATLDAEGKPEGWKTSRVSDHLELAYGKSLPAPLRKPGPIGVYGSGGLSGAHDEALVAGPTVIVGRKGTVGSLIWVDEPCFPIDTVFYVKPLSSLSFCYELLSHFPLKDMNTDAAVPGLNRENVYRLELPHPGQPLIEKFDETTAPIREKLRQNRQQSRTLAQTRDLLLPKLMSGEIRVAEAEREMSAVL